MFTICSIMNDDAPDPILQRQLQLLGDLAEIGLEVARAVEREAKSETRSVDIDRVAMAYSRTARAVRLTIMLQSKVMADAKAEAEKAADLKARWHPVYIRKARVERIVERLAEAEHPDDEDAVDRIVIEAGERLDDEDLYGDVMDRPIGELVALICRDLGLDPDWSRLAEEAWAKEEGAQLPPLAPPTCAPWPAAPHPFGAAPPGSDSPCCPGPAP
jgi:hypothetical protein